MAAFFLTRVLERVPAPTRRRGKTVAPVGDGCEKQNEFVQRPRRRDATTMHIEKQGSAIKPLGEHVHRFRGEGLCGASSTRRQKRAAVAAKLH